MQVHCLKAWWVKSACVSRIHNIAPSPKSFRHLMFGRNLVDVLERQFTFPGRGNWIKNSLQRSLWRSLVWPHSLLTKQSWRRPKAIDKNAIIEVDGAENVKISSSERCRVPFQNQRDCHYQERTSQGWHADGSITVHPYITSVWGSRSRQESPYPLGQSAQTCYDPQGSGKSAGGSARDKRWIGRDEEVKENDGLKVEGEPHTSCMDEMTCATPSVIRSNVNHDDTNLTNKQENCAHTCQCSYALCWRSSGSWWSLVSCSVSQRRRNIKCRCLSFWILSFSFVLVVRLYSVTVNSYLQPFIAHFCIAKNGSFEVLCLHLPSVTVDRRQL